MLNTLLTIAAWTLLAAALILGVVTFIKDGGIKELIQLAKQEDE